MICDQLQQNLGAGCAVFVHFQSNSTGIFVYYDGVNPIAISRLAIEHFDSNLCIVRNIAEFRVDGYTVLIYVGQCSDRNGHSLFKQENLNFALYAR